MINKYEGGCVFCYDRVKPGSGYVANIGGTWDTCCKTCSESLTNWRKCHESTLMSLGDDEGGPNGMMDHEDYRRCREVADMLISRGLVGRIAIVIGVDLDA